LRVTRSRATFPQARPRAPVLAVEFEQIEGVEKHQVVEGAAMQMLKESVPAAVRAGRWLFGV
jgi:hypothetical protein